MTAPECPACGDDLRLPLVLLRVQHLVRHLQLHQQLRQVLRLGHAGRADQHRLPGPVLLLDVLGDRGELGLLGLVDQVGLVGADHRPVRRDRHHAQLVDLVQLGRLGLGGTGHPGELGVEPEVVLQGDGGQGLVLGLDLHPLLGLDGLVHALVVAAAEQHPPGELVDDEHLPVADDVVLVLLVQLLDLDRVVQVADQRRVRGLVEVLDAQLVLDQAHALLGDTDGALALVHLVVHVPLEQRGHPGELLVPARALLGRTGDDQRRARLVDQDGVGLVDDAEVVPALHQVGRVPGHVVAQVVETELVVRAVGDVALVLPAPHGGRHLGQDHADGQPEEPVDAAHVLGVALGQVVVHRDQVHALAGQRVQVGRQHRGERLALTGLHLGDVAEVQRRPAHHLHPEVALADGPGGRLTDHRERLGQQVVEGLAALVVAGPELVGLGPQLLVGEVLDVGFERLDVVGDPPEPFHQLRLTGAEQTVQKRHGSTSFTVLGQGAAHGTPPTQGSEAA